jgi:hypothetical protein
VRSRVRMRSARHRAGHPVDGVRLRW